MSPYISLLCIALPCSSYKVSAEFNFSLFFLFSSISNIFRNGINNQFQVFHLSGNQSMSGIMHQNKYYGDVMIWKRFKCYWFYWEENSQVYSLLKRPLIRSFDFSLLFDRSSCWCQGDGDLKRHDVTVMLLYKPVCQILTYSDVTLASKASTITVTPETSLPRVRSGNNHRQLDCSCYWHWKH